MTPTILITGATKGIGRAIAKRFADGGFNLALCARGADDLAALKSEIQNPKSKILTQVCDVRDAAQLQSFAESALREFGTVDVLVNNAGVFLPGMVHNEEEERLELLIETNLYSAYKMSRLLVPKMMEQKRGSIFNICSVASLQAYPNGGSYSISKFALLGFSKALREEMKPHHVKVTSIMPGATLTDSWSGTTLPDERFMPAEDVAQLVWDVHHLSSRTVVEDIVLRPMLGDI